MATESLAPPLESGRRVFGLDVARAGAIWMVLICHAVALGALKPLYPAWTFEKLWLLGLPGVDLFFVLSGYLIGKILVRAVLQRDLENAGQLGHFWMRRWLRTLPNYIAWFFIYQWWTHPQVSLAERVQAFFCVSNFSQHTLPTMGQSWSLMVEEWFYLLFPLWLFITIKSSGRRTHGAIVAAALPFLLVPLVLKWVRWNQGLQLDDAFLHVWMVTPLRLDSIMIGVLAAVVVSRFPACRQRLGRPWLQVVYGVLFVALYGLVLKGKCRWIPAFTFFDLLFAVWVIGLDQPSNGGARGTGAWRGVVTWSSRLAYSLYLCHVLLWESLGTSLPKAWPGLPVWGLDGILIAAAYLVAWLSYQCIEAPFMRLRERFHQSVVAASAPTKKAARYGWLWQGAIVAGVVAMFVPAYYEPCSVAGLRWSGSDKSESSSCQQRTAWGRSYPRVAPLEISAGDADAPVAKLQIPLPESWRWLQDELACRLRVTLPESEVRPKRKGKYLPDGALCVEVHARVGKKRALVLRRRMDCNDTNFGWERLVVPLRRDYDKLEVSVVQYGAPPPDLAPRVAWVSF